MRDGYRLEPTDNVNLHNLVSPFGERIAEIEYHAYGIEIRPKSEVVGTAQDVFMEIELNDDESVNITSGYPLIESACQPYIRAHYKQITRWYERLGESFTGFFGNPFWGWLFGLIATVLAIWGWLD